MHLKACSLTKFKCQLRRIVRITQRVFKLKKSVSAASFDSIFGFFTHFYHLFGGAEFFSFLLDVCYTKESVSFFIFVGQWSYLTFSLVWFMKLYHHHGIVFKLQVNLIVDV